MNFESIIWGKWELLKEILSQNIDNALNAFVISNKNKSCLEQALVEVLILLAETGLFFFFFSAEGLIRKIKAKCMVVCISLSHIEVFFFFFFRLYMSAV